MKEKIAGDENLSTTTRANPMLRCHLGLWICAALALALSTLLSSCGKFPAQDLAASARFEKPAGWTWVAGETDDDHPVAIGPGIIRRDLEREDKVHPNINLREVSFKGGPNAQSKMPAWIERNIEFTTNTFTITRSYNTTAGEQTTFVTDSGISGRRVVLENRRFHRQLVHIQYYFLIQETIHVLTFTRPASTPEKDEELDKLADAAARSFK